MANVRPLFEDEGAGGAFERAKARVAMHKQEFEVRLVGDAVTPRTVKSSELAELITSWEGAVTKTASGVGNVHFEADEAALSLVGIGEGSNRLTFAVARNAVFAVAYISGALESGRFDDVPSGAREDLLNISRQAVRNGWSFEIVPDDDLNIRPAEISAERPFVASSPSVARGTTTVTGKLLRVGGAKPKAEIRLEDSTILYIRLDERMAREISQRLYEYVSIEGEAVWRSDTWKIEEFTARRITGYRGGDVVEALRELNRLSKGVWDGVDPREYVRSQRAEN